MITKVKDLLCKQNEQGETALYVAAENGHCLAVAQFGYYNHSLVVVAKHEKQKMTKGKEVVIFLYRFHLEAINLDLVLQMLTVFRLTSPATFFLDFVTRNEFSHCIF